MELIETAYRNLVWGGIIFSSLLLCGFLVRAIIGPRFTDRLVAINIMCAKAIIIIVFLSYLFSDSNLLDIAFLYSMISFVAIVVLSKCFSVPQDTNPSEPKKEDSK